MTCVPISRPVIAALIALSLILASTTAIAQPTIEPVEPAPTSSGSGSNGQPAPASSPPPETEPPTPFDAGRIRLSLSAGLTSSFGEQYFAAALGFGVFVVKGLELGIEGQQWFGSGPNVTLVSPLIRYVLTLVPVVHPYAGTFYRHWFIGDDLPDLDTVGGTLGLIYAGGGPFFLGVGAVFEGVVSECDDECFSVYPEISAAITF